MRHKAQSAQNHHGYDPLPQGVHRFPFPYCYRCPYGLEKESCAMHCAKMFEDSFFLEYVAPDQVAAIILEPILGEGGFIAPPDAFLSAKSVAGGIPVACVTARKDIMESVFLPPLVITDEQLNAGFEILDKAIAKVSQK